MYREIAVTRVRSANLAGRSELLGRQGTLQHSALAGAHKHLRHLWLFPSPGDPARRSALLSAHRHSHHVLTCSPPCRGFQGLLSPAACDSAVRCPCCSHQHQRAAGAAAASLQAASSRAELLGRLARQPMALRTPGSDSTGETGSDSEAVHPKPDAGG